MRILLDTNVLVAAVTRDTDRSDEAIELLDRVDDPHSFRFSVSWNYGVF